MRKSPGMNRPAAILLLVTLASATVAGETVPFEDWLAGLRREALERGVSEALLERALADVKPLPRVVELDRAQPELRLGLEEYLSRYVSDTRVAEGKRALATHRETLRGVRARYGVQPRFVVALWGVESHYGRQTGGFRVVDALATLAHEGRRAVFFRGELLDALSILDEGHTSVERMLGSWAGAMGQPQFMPSSFRRYAVDFDGDGRRDIWETPADVLGSAAHYLSSVGWHADQTWGREVRLPAGFDTALLGRDKSQPMAAWRALGVRRADGSDLPTRNLRGSIVKPDPEGAAYLVYANFEALMDWNRSEYFGIAVGLLSDRLREGE